MILRQVRILDANEMKLRAGWKRWPRSFFLMFWESLAAEPSLSPRGEREQNERCQDEGNAVGAARGTQRGTGILACEGPLQQPARLLRHLFHHCSVPATLRAAKGACKRVRDLSWDQMRFLDREKGRDKGLTQFLDEKSYRPGLGGYRRDD